jgi:hypothetical protein
VAYSGARTKARASGQPAESVLSAPTRPRGHSHHPPPRYAAPGCGPAGSPRCHPAGWGTAVAAAAAAPTRAGSQRRWCLGRLRQAAGSCPRHRQRQRRRSSRSAVRPVPRMKGGERGKGERPATSLHHPVIRPLGNIVTHYHMHGEVSAAQGGGRWRGGEGRPSNSAHTHKPGHTPCRPRTCVRS